MGRLKCGHPAECDYENNGGCQWCDEVDDLRRDNKALKAVLHKQAVIVHPGGDVKLACPEVGYLVVLEGAKVFFPQVVTELSQRHKGGVT